MKKICANKFCNNLINTNEMYCNEHKHKKSTNHNKYKFKRNDKWEQAFYNSKTWITVRQTVRERDLGLCINCLTHKRIKKSDLVHHIIELKESRELGLETSNLLSLCASCHQEIHAKYRKGKVTKMETQEKLKYLVDHREGVF
ncbi:MAG: HNH endonuclease [Clostridium chrysemydis]|uniref:HNH endonuclease n=1 Tax=Clostridium chrysemydis TaxID=2665504 RepID=UPI003F3CFA9F